MTDPVEQEQPAPEQKQDEEAAAQAAVTDFAKKAGLFDERQQGVLNDPRDLGPVGG